MKSSRATIQLIIKSSRDAIQSTVKSSRDVIQVIVKSSRNAIQLIVSFGWATSALVQAKPNSPRFSLPFNTFSSGGAPLSSG